MREPLKKAAGALEGVLSVAVDVAGKTVTVEFDPGVVALPSITEAIEDQGYEIQ